MNEQLKIIISAQVDKLKQNVADAKNQVKSFKEQVKEASKNVDDNFQAIGASIKSGLTIAGATITATAGALLALGASTQEYRNEQAKLVSAFESAGSSASVAKDTYNDLYRVLGDSGVAVEASAHLAKLTTSQEALSEWTNICQGVYAEFGSSLPLEGLTEAVNHTAKLGETQGVLADALEWSGMNVDEFNEQLAKCNTESEREKLIRETLSGIYSESASVYEANNAQVLAQNEAQAKLQETTAKLGEAVAPVITAFTSFANDALAVVVPYIQDLSAKYLPDLESLLKDVSSALETAFDWVVEHKTILAVMAGIIGGITTAIGLYNIVSAVKATMDALQVTTLWGLVTALGAQAVAMITAIAPYLLIVAAIAGVIAIIVLCIKHWDKIKETVVKVAKIMWEKVKEMKDKVVDYFSQLWSSVTEKVTNIKNSVVNKFGEIKDGIKKKIDGAREAVKNAIDKMKKLFNFKWSLPKPKFPTFKISGGEVPWGFMGKGSLPKISIKWNKLGGVFDAPTIFDYKGSLQGIGEDGAEAVVPLEKNTKWLDRLATMLNEKQGGTRPIYLQVDGKTFAQISVNSINDLTRVTGKLPIKVM